MAYNFLCLFNPLFQRLELHLQILFQMDIYLILMIYWILGEKSVKMQAWTNCSPDTDRMHSGAQNLCDAPDFSGSHI